MRTVAFLDQTMISVSLCFVVRCRYLVSVCRVSFCYVNPSECYFDASAHRLTQSRKCMQLTQNWQNVGLHKLISHDLEPRRAATFKI